MTVSELCEAAICQSDNAAANLLLHIVGGPHGLTLYTRSLGDNTTRLNRIEPYLNESAPGDVRDTTSPLAMLGDMEALLVHNALSPSSRALLTRWMVNCTTGGTRLRAGLPPGWQAGDKTGSGEYGSTNDIAIVWPQGHKPLLIAAYLTQSGASKTMRDEALAEVASVVSETIGATQIHLRGKTS